MDDSEHQVFRRTNRADFIGPVYLGSTGNQTGLMTFMNSASYKMTALQSGNATADVTYTLPTAAPAVNYSPLFGKTDGTLAWFNSGYYNVKAYGAVGDNSTDDTAAIQAAMDAASAGNGIVFFPGATYKITAVLEVAFGASLLGEYHLGQSGGTVIHQTGSANIFHISSYAGGGAPAYISISGFHLQNGTNQIYAQDGGTWVTLSQITFNTPSNAGVYWRGSIQEWFFRDIEFYNGAYGIYLTEKGVLSGGGVGTNMLWDKCNFYSTYFTGQTQNAINILMDATGTGNNDTFVDLRVVTCTKDGVVFGGGITGVVIINPNTEGNGYIGTTPVSPTTVSTTAGSAATTVASATGLVNGDVCTIKGAGTNGLDWYPTILSIVGATVTMTTTAPTAVTSAELTKYIYSDFLLTSSGGQVVDGLTITGGKIGQTRGDSFVRYCLDASGATNVTMIGTQTGRPVYDPGAIVATLSGQSLDFSVRRPANFLTENFRLTTFGGLAAPRSQISSPPGTDVVVGLLDSTFNASGTYGSFQIRKYDGSRTKLLDLDGTSGALTLSSTSSQIILGATRTVTISAGTPATSSRTWTIPDISGNGTFASREAAETFTGVKTITATPVVSINTTNPTILTMQNSATACASYIGLTGSSNTLGLYISGNRQIGGGIINALSTTASIYLETSPTTSTFLIQTTPTVNASPTTRFTIDLNGNIVPGTAALATNATDGFIYMQSCAGAPSGVPTANTGRLAFLYDSTNNFFYVYNGAWKKVLLS